MEGEVSGKINATEPHDFLQRAPLTLLLCAVSLSLVSFMMARERGQPDCTR